MDTSLKKKTGVLAVKTINQGMQQAQSDESETLNSWSPLCVVLTATVQ